jgi:hypothetical protein
LNSGIPHVPLKMASPDQARAPSVQPIGFHWPSIPYFSHTRWLKGPQALQGVELSAQPTAILFSSVLVAARGPAIVGFDPNVPYH